MKKCKICKQIKQYTEFYKDPTMKDGRVNQCKKCFYLKDRTRALKYAKGYYLRNKVKIKKYVREWTDKKRFGRLREAILVRDCYKCQICKKTHHQVVLHVHHKDNKGRGNKTLNNDIDNLVTLCDSCHHRHHSLKMWKTRKK